MKLTLSQPQYLKDSITIVSDLVTEARFKITSEGLTLIAMDPANVAMVILKLFSSSFVEYNLNSDVDIALNLNNFKQVLKRVGNNDMLTLSLDNNSKLDISISGKVKKKFSLPIIELDEREQKIPNLTFPYMVVMPSTTLVEAIEDAQIVSDSLSLSGDAQKLSVQAKGDLSKVEIEIRADDSVQITSNATETPKSKYAIEYLKKMVAGAKISDAVKLQFSKNYPIRMEFVEQDKIQLSFVLAPRMGED